MHFIQSVDTPTNQHLHMLRPSIMQLVQCHSLMQQNEWNVVAPSKGSPTFSDFVHSSQILLKSWNLISRKWALDARKSKWAKSPASRMDLNSIVNHFVHDQSSAWNNNNEILVTSIMKSTKNPNILQSICMELVIPWYSHTIYQPVKRKIANLKYMAVY